VSALLKSEHLTRITKLQHPPSLPNLGGLIRPNGVVLKQKRRSNFSNPALH